MDLLAIQMGWIGGISSQTVSHPGILRRPKVKKFEFVFTGGAFALGECEYAFGRMTEVMASADMAGEFATRAFVDETEPFLTLLLADT